MGHSGISDEVLLAYLDGALDPSEMARVTEHLDDCWQCRARAREMEEAVLTAANTVLSADGFPIDRMARAKGNLVRRMATSAAMREGMVSTRPEARMRTRWLPFALTASLAFGATSVWVMTPRVAPPVAPREVSPAVRQSEPATGSTGQTINSPAAVTKPAAPVEPLVDKATLYEVWIHAFAAARRGGAAGREQLSIGLSPAGKVVVEGTVDTSERRRELTGVFTRINPSLIDCRLKSREEYRSRSEALPAGEERGDLLLVESEPADAKAEIAARARIEEILRQQGKVPDHSQVLDFADRTIQISEEVNRSLGFLAQLATAFGPEVLRQAGAEPAAELEGLVAEEVQTLNRNYVQLQRQLKPWLPEPGRGLSPSPSAGSWQRVILERQSDYRDVHAAILALFGVPSAEIGTQSASRLPDNSTQAITPIDIANRLAHENRIR